MLLKAGLVVEGALVVVWAITTVNSVAGVIILLAAVVTSLAILGRAARAAARYLRKISHSYTILLQLEGCMRSFEERLEKVEASLDVIKDAERERVVSMLERGAPGRRKGDIIP